MEAAAEGEKEVDEEEVEEEEEEEDAKKTTLKERGERWERGG